MKQVTLLFFTLFLGANSQAVASQTDAVLEYQKDQLKVFLQEFHQNPAKVMDQIPTKFVIGQGTIRLPFVHENKTASQTQMLTEKDRVRKEFCKEVNNKTVCLKDPRGRAQIGSNDRPEDLVDNSETLLRNLGEMDSQGLERSVLETQPWSDDYWPIYSGIVAKRYADPALPYGSDWKNANDWFVANPTRDYVSKNTTAHLSPAEKYDLVLGDPGQTMTKAMWAEGKGYYDANGEVETWMGICHGWAPASYMVKRPQQGVLVKAADGVTEILFYPSDIKALTTLLWANTRTPTRFIGGRCNEKEPQKDEANGRVVDQQCFDTNPGSWHMSVVNQLGVSKRSFVMDATFDYEVWNQPVVAYSYSYFNPQNFQHATSWSQAAVSPEDYKLDKFAGLNPETGKAYRTPETKFIVGVEMEVVYSSEGQPAARLFDNEKYDQLVTVVYRYDLELDENGNILGGEWYSNRHPDFLWTPPPGTKATSLADNYTKGEWEVDKSIPTEWLRPGVYAASRGIPLAKIVDELVERAQPEGE